MRKRWRVVVRLGLMTTLVAAVGCSTTATRGAHDVHQFKPMPTARVEAKELDRVSKPRSATELLRAADEAFRKANAAQEKGDQEASLRHYKKMLEILIEADLDPSIFYGLRSEFERLLKGTTERARLFERKRLPLDKDLAGRVAGDIDIPFPIPERVIAEIEEIQEAYPKNFQNGLNRSSKYVTAIRQQLAEAGLPQDLVWLAMVESQFYSKACSPAGAVGMWQFIRETGRRYNLRVDNYVDERMNWEKATRGAIAYLTELRDTFNGNWPCALAAYNMGEGGMGRLIAANAGNHADMNLIWNLIETPPAADIMRQETKKYYPKLIATILVARNPEHYGFTLDPQPPDQYVRVPVKGSYSLSTLDRACSLSEGTLAKLNPDLIRGVTPPMGEYMVAVPVEANDAFVQALKNVPQADRKTVFAASGAQEAETYVVKRGESAASIAQKHHISVKELFAANKLRSERDLAAGKRLAIPASAQAKRNDNPPKEVAKKTDAKVPEGKSKEAAPSEKIAADEKAPAPAKPVPTRKYNVKKGDTLVEIAKREGVSMNDLLAWNELKKDVKVRAGEVLVLSPATPNNEEKAGNSKETKKDDKKLDDPKTASKDAPAAKDTAAKTHEVSSGECPEKIAKDYGVRVEDLRAWNKLTEKSVIRPGEKLVVAQPGGKSAEPAKNGKQASADDKATAEKSAAEKKDTAKTSEKPTADKGQKIAKADTGQTASSTKDTKDKNSVPSGTDAKGKDKAAGTEKSEGKKVEHEVTPGQNPSTIAKRYGVKLSDVFKWNGWTHAPNLPVGSKVIIYKK